MPDETTFNSLTIPQRAFFIDSENGIDVLIEGCERLGKHDTIIVFHRNPILNKARIRLDLCPATVEWITCLDPGIKNSMDFQIVAEFSLRATQGKFDEGYIISRDNGYKPAVHYLEQKLGSPIITTTAISIDQALQKSFSTALSNLAHTQDKNEIKRILLLLLGEQATETVCKALSGTQQIAEPSEPEVENKNKDISSTPNVTTVDAATTPTTTVNSSLLSTNKASKMSDLRGIGKALSLKLQSVGINTPDKLRKSGAAGAWKAIHEVDPSFSTKWVYTFEAAIQDSSLGDINAERKKQLKREIKRRAS